MSGVPGWVREVPGITVVDALPRLRKLRDDLTAGGDPRALVTEYLRDEQMTPAYWASLKGEPEAGALLMEIGGVHGCSSLLVEVRRRITSEARALREAYSLQRIERAGEDPEPDVWERLDLRMRADVETPVDSLRNLQAILTHDSRWVGEVRRNRFDGLDYVRGRPIVDEGESEVAVWMDIHYGITSNGSRLAGEAVSMVAAEQSWHPIVEYLESLEWDGVPRAEKLLRDGFGAEDAPLTGAISRCWLVSAVARVMSPGCKVDTTPILVGEQGTRKSTGIRALVPDVSWFSDSVIDFGSKDFFEQIQGVWLYEIGELEGFSRSEWKRIKALMSSQVDRWRRPFGRRAVNIPRQCVFVGSTNEDQFLGDVTGSRRFWPVRVGVVDVEAIVSRRDQLWAEAMHLYRSGVQWHLTAEEGRDLVEASDEFQLSHPWEDAVRSWLLKQLSPDVTTTSDVLVGALGKPLSTCTRTDEMQVGNVLRRLGYRRVREGRGAGRRYVYQKVI